MHVPSLRSGRHLALAFCIFPFVAQATDYHISPNGNDAAAGTTTATAWRTLARVNQSTYTFQPGDRILFERGGTYRGELIIGVSGEQNSPITLGAYGTGNDPVIKGSEPVSAWEQHSGNIWRATVARRVDQVYVNGQRMVLARFPNTGWLRNSQGGGNQMASNDLTQPNGHWNGARVVLRRTSSSIDTLVVANYTTGQLQFTTTVPGFGTDDWGFFLEKKLDMLDTPGEWFHDAGSSTLYLWAPNGANPNDLHVEATVHDVGAYVYWQRKHWRIENLRFMHQRQAGVRVDDGHHVHVNNCTFEDTFHGIRSVGISCSYVGNTFRNTYATAALLIDNGTLFADNTLTDIAVVPGLGEHAWGYFGVRSIGQNIVLRNNRFERIGYTAIEANGNALVERNVITEALALLNDGGGIAFDNADGITVQDNVITRLIGGLDGSSTLELHQHHMGNGIYFGNTTIRNATVQRNTVSECPGAGINVDHTMVSSGFRVLNNVLFNNAIQLAVSDYSNYNGPGAAPPYHVPQYNGVFEGNVMYCLTKDQLCMRQYNCYSANPVDFGSYANNRYYNPYGEMSILVFNTYDGGPKYYSFEKWNATREQEPGSTRSPQHLVAQNVADVLSADLVTGGSFDNGVTGWGGWPNNATATHVTTHLDNGALRAHLPNNSQYDTYSVRNPDWFPLENGQWYRMRLSIQGEAPGELLAGLKGHSQLNNPYAVYQQRLAFDTQRRDLELIFQSSMTDQAQVMLINHWTDPTYYLDNVSVHQVAVVQLDPLDRHSLFVNPTPNHVDMPLAGCWRDTDGQLRNQSLSLAPFSSRAMARENDDLCIGLSVNDMNTANSPVRPLRVSPNPTTAGNSVQLDRLVSGELSWTDMNGRPVAFPRRIRNTDRVQVPGHLAPGVYVMSVVEGANRVSARVMVH